MIAAAAQQALDPAGAARAELRLAVAFCNQGRHAEASPIVDRCVTAFGELADQGALATALYWRTVCEWNLGAFDDARQSAQSALQLARDIDDRQTEFLAQRLLAIAQANLPEHREVAVASAERALALARELGEPAFEQETLHTLAHVNNLAGRHEVALRFSQEGLSLARDLGLQTTMAEWLGIRGDAYHGLGRYREAAESLRSALPIYRDHFMRRHHALCLLKMGYAYQALGDRQAAIGHLQECLAIFDQLQLGHYAERARETISLPAGAVSASPINRKAPDRATVRWPCPASRRSVNKPLDCQSHQEARTPCSIRCSWPGQGHHPQHRSAQPARAWTRSARPPRLIPSGGTRSLPGFQTRSR